MFSKRNITFYLLFAFCLLITIYASDFPFFWDNISHISKPAHWYYENSFSSLILPVQLDTGNPTLNGFYIALIWTITGKSLIITHFAFFPFILLTLWQYYRLSKKVLPQNLVPLSMILLAIEPTFLAQTMLMSPDVILLSLFLLSVNSILDGKRIVLSVTLSFLCLVSLRAVLCCMALLLFDYINTMFIEKKKFNLRLMYSYIPFIIVISAWLLNHYFKSGWFTIHKNSPWIENFKPVEMTEIIRNIAILIWRMIDFGRVFLWISIILILGIFIKKINFTATGLKIIYSLLFCFLLIFLFPFILFKNLIAHHYLMFLYLLTLLLFVYLLDLLSNKIKRVCIFLSVSFLLSGHFWVYPDGIAKGWDSSLAFIPFFDLKEKMNDYLTKTRIEHTLVGTHVPNIHSGKFYNLKGPDTSHVNLADEKMENLHYIIESNVCNDFSDDELILLKTKWILLKEFNKWNLYMRLYKNPKI